MTIHLDTSFLIQALASGTAADASMRRWLSAGESLGMSSIAWAELLCGPLTEAQTQLAMQLVSDRISFSETLAAQAATLFNSTGRRRGSLADCMIAATAIAAEAAVATTNADDFERFAPFGLSLVGVSGR